MVATVKVGYLPINCQVTTFFFWFSVLHLYFFIVLIVQHAAQTFMPPAGFEPAIPGSDRPQTLALDRSATGIGDSSRSARQQVISLHSGTLERHFIEKRDDSLKISSWENFGFTEGQSDTNHILFTRVVSSFGRYKDTRRASLVSDPLL